MDRRRAAKTPLRFAITTDPSNFIVNEKRVYGEESKYAGEEYLRPVGYYRTLEEALVKMCDKGHKLEAPYHSTEEIRKAIEDQRQEIKGVVEEFKVYRAAQVKADAERSEKARVAQKKTKKVESDAKKRTRVR